MIVEFPVFSGSSQHMLIELESISKILGFPGGDGLSKKKDRNVHNF